MQERTHQAYFKHLPHHLSEGFLTTRKATHWPFNKLKTTRTPVYWCQLTGLLRNENFQSLDS